uniref:GTP_EFTU_D3 domain-containing protein n=1 Tax=Syphacia muris TaxID=451379 RepID=A0A0N5B027_9BILA
MPNADPVIVKGLRRDSEDNEGNTVAFSGEHVALTLTALNSFEPNFVGVGQVLCRGGSECLVPGKRFIARLLVFNIIIPIMKGTRADLFVHSLCEACTIVKLEAIINKASGQVTKRKPRFICFLRCLTKNVYGVVEIETDRVICIESYSQCRPLGRVTLRSAGQTIAAGIIEKVFE